MDDALLPGLAAVQNVHPLLVHFPIALWSAALLFWALSLRGSGDFWRAGRWLLYLGSLSALVAVATGLQAADRLGHEAPGHELVHVHRNFMIAATALGGATALLAWIVRARRDARLRGGLVAALVLTVVVCVLGADRGALLVYEYGMGTRGGGPEAPVEDSAARADSTGAAARTAPGGLEARHDHHDHPH